MLSATSLKVLVAWLSVAYLCLHTTAVVVENLIKHWMSVENKDGVVKRPPSWAIQASLKYVARAVLRSSGRPRAVAKVSTSFIFLRRDLALRMPRLAS